MPLIWAMVLPLHHVNSGRHVSRPNSRDFADARPAIVFLHELAHAGIAKERLVFALSRTLTAVEEDAARSYIAKAGYEVLAGAIPERAAYREAHNRGQAVTEAKGRAHGPVEELIEALFDKVHALMLAKSRHAKTAARTKERKS